MAYEDLQPVNISFILTEHKDKQAIRRIKLCDIETHEIYDGLIEITLVHIPTVVKSADKTSDLYMFARFFTISSQADADKFVEEFGATELGKGLIDMYNNATANSQNLNRVEASPYFTGRLTEAQLEEERKKAERKALIKTARKMLSDGLTLDIIRKYIDLDIDTLNSLTATN
jgi:predicted transposase/invertase (TIGR01784 family)